MNDVLERIKDFWAGTSLGQKLTLGAATLGVVAAAIFFLSYSGGDSTMVPLVRDVDPAEMPKVVEVIEQNQVAYELDPAGTTVSVPKEHASKLRMALASKGMPSSGQVGFEIFDEGGFGISDFVQRTNYVRALQGELARTISSLDEVKSARVMVVQPQNELILSEDPNDRPSASVFVNTGGDMLDKKTVNAIQFLVANSVKGVSRDRVSVMDNQGNTLSDDSSASGFASSASGHMKIREGHEKRLENKIKTMLAPVVGGANNVVARVAVRLKNKSETNLKETFDPDGAVPRTVTKDKDEATTVESTPNTKGTGASVNTPNLPQDASAEQSLESRSDETRESTSTDYEISRELTETVEEPGDIEQISAAVLIAVNEDGARDQAEIDKIHAAVVNAIGARFTNDGEITTNISVEEMDFSSEAGFGTDTLDSMQNFFDQWGPLLKNVIGIVIAIGIFLVFLRMLKKFKPTAAEVEVLDEADAQALAGTRSIGKGLTPELLNDLIQEKPENASTALKNWVNTGQ
ncbi:MAG: flagellar M-ring protein FliF [Opitutae bacterium]|nr:flagellar M-ring protein FliF [Opitutae bacterium]|tara:strand:- start:1398 stop:2957 length:1560 start_codon:yes stop_codon:yes gene_type:complete